MTGCCPRPPHDYFQRITSLYGLMMLQGVTDDDEEEQDSKGANEPEMGEPADKLGAELRRRKKEAEKSVQIDELPTIYYHSRKTSFARHKILAIEFLLDLIH